MISARTCRAGGRGTRKQSILDETTSQTPTVAQEENVHDIKREVLDLLKVVVILLVLFWTLKAFVIEGYEVQGDSMLPTLRDQDRILVFKLSHKLSRTPLFRWIEPFEEGDILVFEGVGNKRYVKRLIAYNPLATTQSVEAGPVNDLVEDASAVKVEFDRGIVRVNNWQIDESVYLPEKERHTRGRDICYLKPGEYYVLGDNRGVSKDSRSFRAVSDRQVAGKAIVRFWPLSRIKLF